VNRKSTKIVLLLRSPLLFFFFLCISTANEKGGQPKKGREGGEKQQLHQNEKTPVSDSFLEVLNSKITFFF
jgi:hypothetical protein